MATSFNSVFQKFLKLIKDRQLCQLLSEADMIEILTSFLNEATSIYFKNCEKDLKDYISPEFYTQDFISNGGDTYTITQYPENVDSANIQLIFQLEGSDYANHTFDDETLTFTATDIPSELNIVCGYNFIGQFNATLTDEEQWILAHGMVISWNNDKLFDESKLKERLGTRDYNNLHSPANLLDKLLLLRQQSLREIRNLVVDYSFNGFVGFK